MAVGPKKRVLLRILMASILGALLTAAFPPYNSIILLFVSLPLFFLMLESSSSAKQAFWTGWGFGFGHFVTGIYWIANSLLVEPEKFAWLIPFAVSLLPAFLAIYVGLVALATYQIPLKGWRKIIVFGCIWTIAELARGILFTGFPWNLIGYVWTEHLEILQATSVIGVYGLGLLTVVAATMSAVFLVGEEKKLSVSLHLFPVFTVLLSGTIVWLWGDYRLSNNPTKFTEHNIHLIQANIPQKQKWQEDRRIKNFMKHVTMTQAVIKEGNGNDYVIWSETSIPYVLEREAEVLQIIKSTLPDNISIFAGAVRVEKSDNKIKAWNSLYVIRGDGKILGNYDKSRLVPFGEFVPFRSILPSFVKKITHGTGDFSSGDGVKTLSIDGIELFSPLICYEVIFPDYVVNGEDRPSWLLNITNDAWFGASSGPYQHMAMSRVRSIEYGLPLIRVASTGISSIVESHGRILNTIPLNEQGTVSTKLPAPTDPTVYSRYRRLIVLSLLVIMGFIAIYGLRYSNKNNN